MEIHNKIPNTVMPVSKFKHFAKFLKILTWLRKCPGLAYRSLFGAWLFWLQTLVSNSQDCHQQLAEVKELQRVKVRKLNSLLEKKDSKQFECCNRYFFVFSILLDWAEIAVLAHDLYKSAPKYSSFAFPSTLSWHSTFYGMSTKSQFLVLERAHQESFIHIQL